MPTPAEPPRVVINEIAWAGTKASQYGEWFELYNAGNTAVDLAGWGLFEVNSSGSDVLVITLSGTIGPGEYRLIERSTDTSPNPVILTEIPNDDVNDVIGGFGGGGFLNLPAGEHLKLKDGSGTVIDDVPCGSGWFGGDNTTKSTMERIDPLQSGSEPSNWASNDGEVVDGVPVGGTMVGKDAAGSPILGTPRHRNSVSSPVP